MYNGYKNWNQWSVSLWINNDEGMYKHALSLVRIHGKRKAVELLTEDLSGEHTPDGAHYNKTSIAAALTIILH